MTVHRFVLDPSEIAGDRIETPARIAHQLRRVLRLRDGDEILLLDGIGGQARCRIVDGGRWLSVLDRTPATGEAAHRLTVCQALLKGDGLERVIQQGTELGVARFSLFVSERCVVRAIAPSRLARLRTIARESAEQAERGIVPQVDEPAPLAGLPSRGDVVLYERERDGSLRLSLLDPPKRIFVGPEGGFSAGEISAFERAGARIATLGRRILRAESVAIAAGAVVLSASGDFA